MSFIRSKKIKGKTYYYIVENKWIFGRVKQYVLMYLGTADSLFERLKKEGKNAKQKDD